MFVRVSIRFLALLAVAGAPAHAAPNRPWVDASRVTSLRAGIVCHPKEAGAIDAPLTFTGSVRLLDAPEITVETQRIPAFDGTEFGVEIQIADPADADATVTLYRPRLGPEGTSVDVYEMTLDPNAMAYNGFEFWLSDGDPTGFWTFSIATPRGVISETQFEVFRPRKGTAHPCGEFLSS